MKAAILVDQREPLVVAEVCEPDTLQFGQVRVQLCYSGVCGAQINEIDGAKGPDRWLPHLLGHEGSGVVLETGDGVTTVSAGDHVVLHWRPSDGIQSPTPKYSWNGRVVNAGWVTTFNERAIVSENRVTRIPPDFDLRIAPLFGCAVTTAIGVVNRDAKVGIGESVVIFGVGGVGLSIAQAAAMVSAHPVIAVDLHEDKLTLAMRLGATHGLDGKDTDVDAKIREIVGEAGADVVIETTGNARVIERAYQLAHPDGRVILVGVPNKQDQVSIYTLPLHFNMTMKGSHGGDTQPHVDIPNYVRLCESGKLSLDGLITSEFSLDEINHAIDSVRAGAEGRCVISMD